MIIVVAVCFLVDLQSANSSLYLSFTQVFTLKTRLDETKPVVFVQTWFNRTTVKLISQPFVLNQACWGRRKKRFLKLILNLPSLYCFVWEECNLRSLTPENEKPTRKFLFVVFCSDVISGHGRSRLSLWKSNLSLILSWKKETGEHNLCAHQ